VVAAAARAEWNAGREVPRREAGVSGPIHAALECERCSAVPGKIED